LFDPLSTGIKLFRSHSEKVSTHERIDVPPGESEPSMIVMLIVGWTVVLPAIVVVGLLLASSILGRRARRRGVIDLDAFAREINRLSTPRQGRRTSLRRRKRRSVRAAY
jgi:hypothetical protein